MKPDIRSQFKWAKTWYQFVNIPDTKQTAETTANAVETGPKSALAISSPSKIRYFSYVKLVKSFNQLCFENLEVLKIGLLIT